MKKLNSLIAAIIFVAISLSPVYGGWSSSSSSSIRSSSSSSWSSSSSKSSGGLSWGSSSSSAPSKSSWGSSSSSASTPNKSSGGSSWNSSSSSDSTPKPSSSSWGSSSTPNNKSYGSSSTDRALASKTVMTPKAQRSDIVNNFKTQNATKYTTTFVTEPTIRPAYVPQVYYVGGMNRTVYYDYNHGGYGYWNAVGTFMLYDALTLEANRHAAYEIHQQNAYNYENGNGGSSILLVLLVTIVALVIIGGTFTIISANSNNTRY